MDFPSQPFVSIQFSSVKYINIILKPIFRIFDFTKLKPCPLNSCPLPCPSPQPPFLLCELGSAPCGALTGGDHTKNSNIHFLNKHPGQRPCQLEGETSWSWNRKVGFMSKSLFSRESKITESQRFADFTSVTRLGPDQRSAQRLREPKQSTHATRTSWVSSHSPEHRSCVWSGLGSALLLFCLILPLDS